MLALVWRGLTSLSLQRCIAALIKMVNPFSWYDHLRKLSNRSGQLAPHHWLWIAFAVLSCYVSVIIFLFIPSSRVKNKELEQHIQKLKMNLSQIDLSDHPDQLNPVRSKLATFNRLSAVVNDFTNLALENDLQLIDMNFQPVDDAISKEIFRLEITVHLKGGYASVKKIIAGLLAEHDGLALESISIERSNPTDLISNVKLGFIFYYR